MTDHPEDYPYIEEGYVNVSERATNRPGPRISVYISADATDEELTFARQLAVDCAYIWVSPAQRSLAFLTALRQRVESYGIELYMVGNMNVGKSDKIHLALPGRDEDIAAFQELVRSLGAAGIHVTTFTWEPDQVWSSEVGEARGAPARQVDMGDLRQRPFTHGRAYSEAELWDNFAYFMERIIPVAEGAGVRLALHPNDPPTDVPLGGIPCIIRSAAAYRRAFQIANSPALGMEFCCGCWLEGGEAFGDILAGIREFQADGRILIVHFRNVTAPLPHFVETLLDDGYMNMAQVMRALVESGYGGTITLDHTPHFVGPYAQGGGTGYGVGYMKALLRCIRGQRG
jgi:mannonate dehydratase